ncbi:MAG: nucleoside monophosphate kinase [Planctomycetes bacterium]|nr:nucleoside monophosphate kinase [Planctomycetota bacterium]
MNTTPTDKQPTRPPCPAVLLLGPTGAGKTPLGEVIQERGIWGWRCLHFDFGQQLRQLVDGDRPDDVVSRADLDFLARVLHSGALLEDKDFPIAERILRSFLRRNDADRQTVVLLNGLPRHVGQAAAVSQDDRPLVGVTCVVRLECSAETVFERIHANTGGDRDGRTDDDLDAIRRKLQIYENRTQPLADYYQTRGTRIETIAITATMPPEEAYQELDRRR